MEWPPFNAPSHSVLRQRRQTPQADPIPKAHPARADPAVTEPCAGTCALAMTL